jgi:hypothetical protein
VSGVGNRRQTGSRPKSDRPEFLSKSVSATCSTTGPNSLAHRGPVVINSLVSGGMMRQMSSRVSKKSAFLNAPSNSARVGKEGVPALHSPRPRHRVFVSSSTRGGGLLLNSEVAMRLPDYGQFIEKFWFQRSHLRETRQMVTLGEV